MVCTHLKQLYQLCERNGVRISSSDLVHIVCKECGVQEVCPSMLMTEYDSKEEDANAKSEAASGQPKKNP